MILELITTLSQTPETVKQVFGGANAVSFTPVDPMVIYLNVFATIGAVLVAVMGWLASLNNKKKIQEVHILVNNQLAEYKLLQDKILEFEKAKARAEGDADAVSRMQAK